jgi:hypothetical protein
MDTSSEPIIFSDASSVKICSQTDDFSVRSNNVLTHMIKWLTANRFAYIQINKYYKIYKK